MRYCLKCDKIEKYGSVKLRQDREIRFSNGSSPQRKSAHDRGNTELKGSANQKKFATEKQNTPQKRKTPTKLTKMKTAKLTRNG